MVRLTNDTVEAWLDDCEAFTLAFMEYTFEWHHAVGADLELLRSEIESAHADWIGTVTEWRNNRFQQETESLSYTKIFAILIWALCNRTYIGEMKEYVPFRHQPPEFNGTEAERLACRADLLGAPEAVSALQFCLSVLNFYEANRLDKRPPFAFRMTESGRHDLLVMLTSKEAGPTSLYIALEGFYARD